ISLFCDQIEEINLKIYWQCTSKVYSAYTEEFLERMKKNGCVLLNIGLESANNRILKIMRKGFTVDHIKTFLRNVKAVDIPVHLYCICGFPGETIDESEYTASFLIENKDSYHSVYFQNYNSELANKIFTSTLGSETEGYDSSKMIPKIMKDEEMNKKFAVRENLIRKKGFPFIEVHNFLYLANKFGQKNGESNEK
ncbi:MAG: radical SAM protein, partial [Candidatus Hodarchaeota archaeon]